MRCRHLLLHPHPSTIPFHPNLHAAWSSTPTTATSRFHPSRDRTRATTRNVPTTIRITGTRTAVPEDHLSRAVRKKYSSANRVERGLDVVSRWLSECMRDVSRCGLLRSLRSITQRTPPTTAPNTVPNFKDVQGEDDAFSPAVNLWRSHTC